MNINLYDEVTSLREEIIVAACRNLVENLRLLEPMDYFLALYSGNNLALGIEIQSLIDRHFKENSLTFDFTGECSHAWRGPFSVALDMELFFRGVFAFFRLHVFDDFARVELNHISFEHAGFNPDENTQLLSKVINSART